METLKVQRYLNIAKVDDGAKKMIATVETDKAYESILCFPIGNLIPALYDQDYAIHKRRMHDLDVRKKRFENEFEENVHMLSKLSKEFVNNKREMIKRVMC